MGEKDTPFNLFSSSGKKKPPASPADQPAKPAPVPYVKPHKPIVEMKLDRQTQELINNIKDMQQKIKDRVDYITSKTGVSKETLMKMATQGTGSKRDLDKLNADLMAFSDLVWNTVGTEYLPKEKTPDVAKNRKGKTIGSRRNWMRMP